MTQLAPQFLLGLLATASLLGGNIAYAASFSITPVPLGDPLLLLASGVSLLVGGRRRLT